MEKSAQEKEPETPGERVAALRQAHGMKQEELAERVGVHAQTISKWERGEQDLRVKYLASLAQELGTTVQYLVTGDADGVKARQVALRIAAQRMEMDARRLRAEADELTPTAAPSDEHVEQQFQQVVAEEERRAAEAERAEKEGQADVQEPRRRRAK